MNTNRPLLVMDLDECLWHGTLDYAGEVISFDIRPYLKEFLNDIMPHYDLAIWTAGSLDWAAWGLNQVKEQTGVDLIKLSVFFWTRSRCKLVHVYDDYGPYQSYAHRTTFTKPINRIRKNKKIRSTYDFNRILAIDDTAFNYRDGYGHLVHVPEWKGDVYDSTLLDLAKYLISIKDTVSFRQLNKRNWQSHAKITVTE